MDTIDAIGLLLGVIGLAITLWQLHKTRSAAEAAKESASQVVVSIQRFEAATKMHEVCARSRELLRVLHGRTLAPAAHAAFELRDAMARYGHDPHSQAVATTVEWKKAHGEAREIHERLETAALVNRIGADERAALLHSVARLHTEFTSMAAKAAANGVNDANT
ncbi:hypothetical protein ETQ85_04795 [Zoogloea oleivorans]|uniref:DUF2489 domain-containing protein n=1 Tax=Zoogloea oleivorans TaxID=1552750 RepID=A0A6C2D4Z9_9RHOO|nr:hypothetical protein [Zoogloea oleivorans]TYC60719.1 hypothetical protein ETQ85_04795 [Zoogloea oleivorans]